MRRESKPHGLLRALAWTFWLAACPPALAQAWADVPEALRPTLAAWAGDWPSLDAATRHRLLTRAADWQAMSPLEQSRRLARLARWQALTPAQRAALRLNLPHWRALSPGQQQALVEGFAVHAARSTAERERREAAFEALSPAARRALLPTASHADLEALARRSFTFVPDEAQEATLAALSELGPQARQDLETLSRRLAPWQREALRGELLAQPAGDRAAWLRERAGQR